MKIWLEPYGVIEVENELKFRVEERWFHGKDAKVLIINNLEIPLRIGLVRGQQQLNKVELLTIAKYYANKHDFLKKLDEWRTKKRDFFGKHIDMIALSLQKFAENNAKEEELDKFLNYLQNLFEREEKVRRMKEELNGKLTRLDNNLEYYESDKSNLKLLLFRFNKYDLDKPIYYLFLINKETKEVEFRKTKSLTTIYNILFENKLNQIGRLQEVTSEDFKMLGNDFVFYLKAIIFDYEGEIKKKILGKIISSNL